MKNISSFLLMILADTVILAVTLIVFFIGFNSQQRIAFDYIALIFVLLSEAMLFAGTALVSKGNVLLKAGVLSTLSLYWIAATLISILYRPLLGINVNGLITTQIILLALALLAVIGIVALYLNTKNKNEESPTY